MKMATLQEVDTHWTFVDLIDFHDALSLKTELEANMLSEVESKFKT